MHCKACLGREMLKRVVAFGTLVRLHPGKNIRGKKKVVREFAMVVCGLGRQVRLASWIILLNSWFIRDTFVSMEADCALAGTLNHVRWLFVRTTSLFSFSHIWE